IYRFGTNRFLDHLHSNGISNSNGYPMSLRKVSLINGSQYGIQPGVNGKLFGMEMIKKINVLFGYYNLVVAESQIYATPPSGRSKVAYLMVADEEDRGYKYIANRYAKHIPNNSYLNSYDNAP